MPSYDYDVGVIGGGAAGLTVTSGAAQLGARTLLIEREPALGGDCLHFGCVPSKTLIHSAHVYHLMRHAERLGLPAVDPPRVDFGRIARRIQEVIAVIQKHDSVERFCRLGAKVTFGEPCFTDEHAVRLNGETVTARKWVLATGSRAFVPPIPGLTETPFITNREIFSLPRLPDTMVILGGGPIGIEMAQAFTRLGTAVTVVDRGPQILPKEDPDMASLVQQRLEAEGVRFSMESTAAAVEERNDRRHVTVAAADGEHAILEADALLVATGRRANVDGLGLEGLGIEPNPRGIAVDARLRTASKHIWAAGDVNGGYQFTHAAGYEGGIVISNMIFHLPRKADYTHMPWCTYTSPELASIGMNETAARKAGIDYTVHAESFEANDRSLAEGEPAGQIKLLLDGAEKPLGVQILGPQAGELLGQWVAALNGKVKLATLAAAVQPYPTIAEINKRVVGSVFSPKIFSDKVKKTLKVFFSLKGRACGCDEETGVCREVD